MNNEEELIKLQEEKVKADRRLLNVEIVLGLLTLVSFLTILYGSIYVMEALNTYVIPILLIILSIIILIVGVGACLFIEQKAGYYECSKCHHKYIPTYNQALWSMHIYRTRYFKCPKCKQWSWNKKVLK